MVNSRFNNKLIKSLLWAAPVGLMMISGGQATANTILLDGFDSNQLVTNIDFPNPAVLESALDDSTVVGSQREMIIVSPGAGENPTFTLGSNFLEPGQLAYQSGGNPANIATSIVRWDGDQDPFDFDLNFELGGFDATGMGMNNSFIWEGFNLDVADGGGSTFLKMRAYSGDSADTESSQLILELNEDTVSDLLIFNFADFSELNVGGGLADFTALTAIEFEIMAPGTTDVTLDLLESGFSVNPSGPANVPEPGTVMAMAALGLTGLLAKRKKVK